MNKLLENQIKNNNIFHAYIFEGQLEDVKVMYTDFIEAIFQSDDKRSKELGINRFFDVEIITPENNIITIDKIREVKKKVFEIPLEAEYKVFVIESADSMRAEAQNALLKTLEEAPEYCIIILTTDNRNKLYDTIISRCQVVSDYLETNGEIAIEDFEELISLFQKAYEKKCYAVIASKPLFEKLQDQKKDVLNVLQKFFSDVLMYKFGQDSDFSTRYRKKLAIFTDLSLRKIESMIFELEKISELTKVNINFQLAMEHVLFTLMEE